MSYVNKIITKKEKEIEVKNKRDDSTSKRIFLVQGKNSGKLAWYYIRVYENMISDFLNDSKRSVVSLKLYGDIVSCGFGNRPLPEDIKALVNKLRTMQ
jgi:hypothetical protein